MATRAVLTGDLIHSRKTATLKAYGERLRSVLSTLDEMLDIQAEITRGDQFQVVPHHPENALLCAVLIRAALIGASPQGERWDARIAVGVGAPESENDYGEAFIMSGKGLDRMKRQTMTFHSRRKSLRDRLELSTQLVAGIIDRWTSVEAMTYYAYRTNKRELENAAKALDKTIPTVSKALKRAHAKVLDLYVMRSTGWIREMDDD